MFPTRLPLLAVLLSSLAAACGDAPSDAASGAPEVVRERLGDTTVVRTTSGSVWGAAVDLVPEVEIGVLEGDPAYMLGRVVALAVDEGGRIFALDRQARTLRVFDSDGRHVADWGRDGNGPGELAQPDGGLVVLSDGRAVARDPGNARLQVFASDGTRAAEWPVISGGFQTSNPMKVDAGDTIYTFGIMNMGAASPDEWERGLIAIHEGAVVDSLVAPDTGYEAPEVRAEWEGSVNISLVPFSPREFAEWHTDGFWIHGISDRYALTLLDPAGPVRIERDAPRVPVASGERAWHRDELTRRMRGLEPGWTWDAEGIPEQKPAWEEIFAADDGRIWVRRPTEGVRGPNPDHDPTDPENEAPEFVWSEALSFDVFERDGTFLGTVHAPADLQRNPRPVFQGEHVWGIAEDEFGVQRIVRYRLRLPTAIE